VWVVVRGGTGGSLCGSIPVRLKWPAAHTKALTGPGRLPKGVGLTWFDRDLLRAKSRLPLVETQFGLLSRIKRGQGRGPLSGEFGEYLQ